MTAFEVFHRIFEVLETWPLMPQVVDGNRLEINRRLKAIQDREGVQPGISSWTDGTRMVPVTHEHTIKRSRE